MSPLDSVAVLIPSWNGREHLEHCLPAVLEQHDPGCRVEVLVFDNGSSDGTAEWLERRYPTVRLLRSEQNVGFCTANNRLVAATDADGVVLLNNDTRPRPGWLRALVEVLDAAPRDVAAVSGLILDWEGERLDFARGALTFDGHAFQVGQGQELERTSLPTTGDELLFPCGGNALIRRRSFLDAGGFDDGYFAYLEDVDLGWRLWAGGERVLFSREAAVHHRSMATSDRLGAARRGFLFERNAFATAAKNYDRELWPRLMPAVLLTLQHRLDTLMSENNPGGATLHVDPYAEPIDGAVVAHSSAAADGDSRLTVGRVLAKWRQLGTRETLRRFRRRLVSRPVSPPTAAAAGVELRDERTLHHLRAAHAMLASLDRLATQREALLARRRRSDREIFERFPLWIVPTYPGDETLFASAGFEAWLPEGLEFRRARLDEVIG